MELISNKARVIYAALDMLEAHSREQSVTAYTILDFLSEHEEVENHPILQHVSEIEFVDIIMEITIKGVSTILTSLSKKGYVNKGEPENVVVDGETRFLRKYFLQKQFTND